MDAVDAALAERVAPLRGAPAVLLLQLSRFQKGPTGRAVKFGGYFSFGEELCLPGAVPATYKLIAVVAHVGRSADQGHYKAYLGCVG